MKHTRYKGVLALIVAMLTVFGMVTSSAGAHEASRADSAFGMQAAEVSVEATEEAETSNVTNLPETGRGTGSMGDDAGVIALHQLVMTVLVLLAAAVLALGGIALVWRYDRA